MKTVVLKFNDNYAPADGTIIEHQKIIDEYGYVWYGKKGNIISQKLLDKFNEYSQLNKKIILVRSVSHDCYLADVEIIENFITPEKQCVPKYYSNDISNINCWIKILNFHKTDKKILEKATVCSSQKKLSAAFYHSMTPIFIIDIEEKEMK